MLTLVKYSRYSNVEVIRTKRWDRFVSKQEETRTNVQNFVGEWEAIWMSEKAYEILKKMLNKQTVRMCTVQ
jgi:hypothetical protein